MKKNNNNKQHNKIIKTLKHHCIPPSISKTRKTPYWGEF